MEAQQVLNRIQEIIDDIRKLDILEDSLKQYLKNIESEKNEEINSRVIYRNSYFGMRSAYRQLIEEYKKLLQIE